MRSLATPSVALIFPAISSRLLSLAGGFPLQPVSPAPAGSGAVPISLLPRDAVCGASTGSSLPDPLSNSPSLLHDLSINTSCPRAGKVLPGKGNSCFWAPGCQGGQRDESPLKGLSWPQGGAGGARALAAHSTALQTYHSIGCAALPSGVGETSHDTDEECMARKARDAPKPHCFEGAHPRLGLPSLPLPSSSSWRLPGLHLGKGWGGRVPLIHRLGMTPGEVGLSPVL